MDDGAEVVPTVTTVARPSHGMSVDDDAELALVATTVTPATGATDVDDDAEPVPTISPPGGIYVNIVSLWLLSRECAHDHDLIKR